MRNLKRALSLAMASIMLLGMMVISAGAVSFDDFSDKDKVVNKEAVSILNTLNVIAGKDGGVFDPEGIVTRAEMAKMIAVILNGGRDPQLGSTSISTYTDTVGNWAAGYIAFCTNFGIVSGDGKGNFNPAATVTGSEAAKMLLVSMGYNATYQKMTGAQWAVSVDALANQKSLYSSLDKLDPSQGLSRDNAAQMIYNALGSDMVEYTNALVNDPITGALTSIPTVKNLDGKTILTEKFGAIKIEGIVLANEYADTDSTKADSDIISSGVVGASLDAGKTVIQVTNGTENKNFADGAHTFTVASGADAIGRTISMYVKPYSASKTNAEKATVIGGIVLKAEAKVVKDYSGDSIADVADDNKLKFETDASYLVNYNSGFENLTTAIKDNTAKADYAGTEKVLIDADGNGKIDYVLLNTYELGKVTKYSTKDDGSITVTGSKAVTFTDSEKVIGFDKVAKDDYVIFTIVGGRMYAEKAETVTGVLNAYKQNSDSENTALTVDGTKYDTSFAKVNTGLTQATEYESKTNLSAEATFYLDLSGRIVAVGDVENVAYKYAYVIGSEKGGTFADNRAKVVLDDGTKATYIINSKSLGKADGSTLKAGEFELKAGHVYSYSITSDSEIKFTEAKAEYEGTSAKFEKGKSTIAVTGGDAANYYANSSTVFFYVDADDASDVNVHTGRDKAPSIDTTTSVILAENKNGDIVAAVFVGTSTKAAAGDNMFVYSWGNVYSDYTEANAVVGGKEETETLNSVDATYDSDNDDMLYLYTTTKDGYYSLTKAALKGSYYDNDKDYYVAGEVVRSTSSSVVVKVATGSGVTANFEFDLKSTTSTIDNVDPTKTPSVTLGGQPTKGDTVQILLDGSKILTMVITANAA